LASVQLGGEYPKGDPGKRQSSSGCNSLSIREKYLVLAVLGAEAEEAVNADEEAGVKDDGGQQQQHPQQVHVLRCRRLLDGVLQLQFNVRNSQPGYRQDLNKNETVL
jgi:hypothetical protein